MVAQQGRLPAAAEAQHHQGGGPQDQGGRRLQERGVQRAGLRRHPRKVGDFGRYTDPASGTKFYACGSCRKPLALTDEQRARIAASKEAAIDKQMLAAAAKAEREYLLAHGQDEDVLVCQLAL